MLGVPASPAEIDRQSGTSYNQVSPPAPGSPGAIQADRWGQIAGQMGSQWQQLTQGAQDRLTGFHQGTQFAASSTDPLTALLQQQLFGAQNDAQMAGQFLATDTSLANALYGHNVSGLTQQHGFDQALMNNARYRDVDLARQQAAQNHALGGRDAALEFANLARLNQVAGTQLGNQYEALDRFLGRNTTERDNTIAALKRNLGLADSRFDLGRQENQAAFNASSRRNVSDATNRGSTLSAGFRDARFELADQLRLADEAEGLTYRGAMDDYTTGFAGAELKYRTGVDTHDAQLDSAELGYESTIGDNNYRRDKVGLERDRAKADLDLRNKMIDSIASDYGIKSDELNATLKRGIDRLGIDLQSTLNQLAKDFQAADAQRRANANTIMGQLIQMGQAGGATTPAPVVSSTGMTPAQIEQARWAQIAEQMERNYVVQAQDAQPGPSPAYSDTGMSPSFSEGPGFGLHPLEQERLDALAGTQYASARVPGRS